MLDRSKIVAALQQASQDLFVGFTQEMDVAGQIWRKISQDIDFATKVHKQKQSLLVPFWQGLLGEVVDIAPQKNNYSVVSVDGSQIYYDKHQGPPCFLINVGFIQLRYGLTGKAMQCGSEPALCTKLSADNDFGSPDFVNMERESLEFSAALQQMQQLQEQVGLHTSLCLFDGSLIFFHLDTKDMEFKELFLKKYCDVLQKMYEQKMLIAGYMSLPRTKELVNLCKFELVQFDAAGLENTSDFAPAFAQGYPTVASSFDKSMADKKSSGGHSGEHGKATTDAGVIDRLTDVDIAELYLKVGQRSIVFKSLASISYLYPQHLKPYFCYLHVGSEIARIEFPAWIAQSDELVNQVCGIALDQSVKGRGYPVCLFEAHEQAVIKAIDRDFFYRMIEKLSQQQAKSYLISQKSIKKQQPIL